MKLTRLTKSDYLKLMGKKRRPRVNQNHVIFIIYEFSCTPNEINKKLSLRPTFVRLKGEEYRIGGIGVKRTAKENIWQYEIKTFSNKNLSDHLNSFVAKILKPKIRALKIISKKAEMQLRIVQYYYTGHNPVYHFAQDTVKLLSEIDAEIVLDIYCLSEEK